MQRPSRFLSAALASVLGASVAIAVSTTAASAAEPDLTVTTWDRPGAGDAAPDDEVCTAQAQPLAEGQDPALLPPTLTRCFDSFEEAVASVTGAPVSTVGVASTDRAGALAAIDAANARSLAAAPSAETAVISSMILGLIWRNANYSGKQTLLWGKGAYGCTKGSTYGFPNMADFLQNNVISSADTIAGCWSTFYNEYDYWGDRRNCTPSCPTMGTMNNRASSIVYRPKGTLG